MIKISSRQRLFCKYPLKRAVSHSTWYHLDHQLWTPQNLTIPVITATWILGLLAEPLMELLNKTMPWHKLLVPEPADESTKNSSEISQQ